MRPQVRFLAAAVLCLCLAPSASWADLEPYSQDFEGLDAADTGALAADGWLVFANVFNPGWAYLYGYGPFPAPNDGAAFSAIVAGEGGPAQGTQQLSVYSDYNNGDHGNGNFIEANVFQEQIVGAANIGHRWNVSFDAKRGNIEGLTSALAFIKTLDPNNGFALTNFVTLDLTSISNTWSSYFLSIIIDPALEGQILQFGFLSTATNYDGSGVFYDNVSFFRGRPLLVTMDELSAKATEDGVLVTWSTATELDTVGFRVLRETADGRRKALVPVSSLIVPNGNSLTGATYEYLDDSKGAERARYYWIEDVDTLGKITRHGPIEVQRVRTGGARRIATER